MYGTPHIGSVSYSRYDSTVLLDFTKATCSFDTSLPTLENVSIVEE
jgi:hypothetical protein